MCVLYLDIVFLPHKSSVEDAHASIVAFGADLNNLRALGNRQDKMGYLQAAASAAELQNSMNR